MNLRKQLYNLATDRYRGFTPGIFKVSLLLGSFLYGIIVGILIFFCRIKPYRARCKVVSVGNITLGGTGKTVLVEAVARYLKDRGHKVAVISRGYKRVQSAKRKAQNEYEIMGDEPYMLKMNLKDVPVIVNPDRIKAIQKAIENHKVDTVILDDGFQQWRVRKDLEIVTLDGVNPFGNRHLIPRGIMREPVSSLKKADIIVLTDPDSSSSGQDSRNILTGINPQALILESLHAPVGFYKLGKEEQILNTDILRGKTVSLVCAIGNPASFRDLIVKMGIRVGLSFDFPDHHRYSAADLQSISRRSRERNIKTMVTTQKDAVKFSVLDYPCSDLEIFVLRVEARLKEDGQKFYNRLLGIYSA